MHSSYVLYGREGGGSMAPQFVLEELGLPYRMEWLPGPLSPEQTAAYLPICPTGKIPALVLLDGSPVFESAAICIHLTDLDGTGRLAPPRGTSEHARFLQWMLFLSASLYDSILRFYYASRYTLADDAGGVKEVALTEFEAHLALLESRVSDYVLVSGFSAADLYLYMLAGWHPDGYDGIRQKFPKIAALCTTVGARSAVKKVMGQNS